MTHFTLLSQQIKAHFYGLDVHQETISISFADGPAEPVYLTTISNTADDVKKFFKPRLREDFQTWSVYEAGGCGFILDRLLKQEGINNIIAAPSKITKTVKEVKNDKRDSLKLTKLLRNHVLMGAKELHEVFVPDEKTEAIQDVTRTRDFCKRQAKRTQSKVLAMLRKYGIRYILTKTKWNKTHRRWLESVDFHCPIKQGVYRDLLDMLRDQESRVDKWDKELEVLCHNWNKGALVKALCSLKGIKLLTAMCIVAEIGEFNRFEHPKYLMAYLGLVPSEYSSGKSVTRGRITKTGNKRVRTLLIEASHAAMRTVKSKAHFQAAAPKGLPSDVLEHAFKARVRLNKTYYRLLGQGKNSAVAKVAVAREMAGFIWAIALQMETLAAERKAA